MRQDFRPTSVNEKSHSNRPLGPREGPPGRAPRETFPSAGGRGAVLENRK